MVEPSPQSARKTSVSNISSARGSNKPGMEKGKKVEESLGNVKEVAAEKEEEVKKENHHEN